jgi:hypothetical protein
LGDDQYGRRALSFEQGVRRHRRTHLDGFNSGISGHDAPNALGGGVGVLAGVLRQQLSSLNTTIRAQRHHVGECSAPINPELPFIPC